MPWWAVPPSVIAVFLLAIFGGNALFERIRRTHDRPWFCPTCGEQTRNPRQHRCGW